MQLGLLRHTTPAPASGACTQDAPVQNTKPLHDTAPGLPQSGMHRHTSAVPSSGTCTKDDTTLSDNERYLAFVAKALAAPTPNATGVKELDDDVRSAVEWLATTSDSEVRRAREEVVTAVEKAAAGLRDSGATTSWLSQADSATKQVSAEVNGPLAEMLARATNFPDQHVFDVFRHGGNVSGELATPHGAVPALSQSPTQ